MWSYQITGLSEPDVDNLLSLESLCNIFFYYSWNNLPTVKDSVIQLSKIKGAILHHIEAKNKLRIKSLIEALTKAPQMKEKGNP